MKKFEKYILDTNILIHAHNIDSQYHQKASEIQEKALKGEIKVVIAQQNLLEFFAIVTDKKRIQRPIKKNEALEEIEKYIKSFEIIYPKENTLDLVIKEVKKLEIRRGEIFDAYMIMTMRSNSIEAIFTEDEEHFKKYKDIEVINPFKTPIL